MVCINCRADLLVVGPESLVVHVKEEDTASINSASDGEILCYRWVAGRWEWKVRSGQGEVVLSDVSALATHHWRKTSYIATFAVIVRGSLCFRYGGCIGLFIVDRS